MATMEHPDIFDHTEDWPRLLRKHNVFGLRFLPTDRPRSRLSRIRFCRMNQHLMKDEASSVEALVVGSYCSDWRHEGNEHVMERIARDACILSPQSTGQCALDLCEDIHTNRRGRRMGFVTREAEKHADEVLDRCDATLPPERGGRLRSELVLHRLCVTNDEMDGRSDSGILVATHDYCSTHDAVSLVRSLRTWGLQDAAYCLRAVFGTAPHA
jgi:hypothetical protein